jgi:hypothetical protein
MRKNTIPCNNRHEAQRDTMRSIGPNTLGRDGMRHTIPMSTSKVHAFYSYFSLASLSFILKKSQLFSLPPSLVFTRT